MIFVVQPTTQVDCISYIPDVWEDDPQLTFIPIFELKPPASRALPDIVLAHYQ